MKMKVVFYLVIAATMLSCKQNMRDNMKGIIMENIEGQLDNSQGLKFVFSAEVDSAFGSNYYTQKDLDLMRKIIAHNISILDTSMKDLSFETLPSSSVLRDLKRNMKAADDFRFLCDKTMSGKKGNFTGWRMQVLYSFEDKEGTKVENRRWVFFDKEGKNVVNSFEIPILKMQKKS